MVVVLPAPFGPRKAKTSPALDLEVDAPDRLEVAVGLVQPADRDNALAHPSIIWRRLNIAAAPASPFGVRDRRQAPQRRRGSASPFGLRDRRQAARADRTSVYRPQRCDGRR